MRTFLSSFLLVAAALFGHAATIIDNGPPLFDVRGGQSDSAINRQRADDFTLSQAQVFSSIVWYGSYGSDSILAPDQFRLRIFASSSGHIPATPSYESVLLPVDRTLTYSSSILTYRYAASFDPLALEQGTYWLSILNSTGEPRVSLDGAWHWTPTSIVDGNAVFRGPDVNPWISDSFGDLEYSFTLIPIPEPGTFSLLLLSFFALAGVFARLPGRVAQQGAAANP